MPSSDGDTNAAVTGTISPSDSDIDWSKGHIIIYWPVFSFYLVLLIAGVGLIVWLIRRK